jgi:hypothetical protein
LLLLSLLLLLLRNELLIPSEELSEDGVAVRLYHSIPTA